MCGIVALINNDNRTVNVNSLLQKIHHRGPDDLGWVEWQEKDSNYGKTDCELTGEVLLGHVRLSIIDLSQAGWQPMASSCGRYSMVYNGEIYNYKELREELKTKGYEFNSESDSEVLLSAIIEWNEKVFSRLRGMFSFVFYDSWQRSLLVARDFFGIKPLYWCHWDGGIALASEARVLLDLPGVTDDSDPQVTYDYLVFGVSDHGTQSIYKDLHYIPAAHYAKLDLGGALTIKPQKYWCIDIDHRVTPTFAEAVQEVRRLFLQSVSLHLRSDVPVGTALSGGIDSSAIVCAIRHLRPDQEIHSFSFIADEEEINEEHWIDLVNQHANCISHKVKAKREELLLDLDDLISTQGEPFGSTSIYAQYRVFKKASQQQIKVMLDGQGADEILAGYVGYQGSRLASLIYQGKLVQALRFLQRTSTSPGRSVKSIIMLTISEILPNWLKWWARMLVSRSVPPKWISPAWRSEWSVNSRPNLASSIAGPNKLKGRLLETLNQSSIPHLLRYEDRNSMRFSIESRVPFLHVDLVEYLYSLPDEYLISSDGVSKHVFREAMRGIVPDEILDRKDKIGFATPERSWLSKMDFWIQDLFLYAENLPFFNMPEISREWTEVVSGRKEFNFRCWRWLNVMAWEKAKKQP